MTMMDSYVSFFLSCFFFFFNDTATTEIYTLSLHDALPISQKEYIYPPEPSMRLVIDTFEFGVKNTPNSNRSEEHTSELQSHLNLVCRLLLEKKKKKKKKQTKKKKKKKTKKNKKKKKKK